MSVSCLTLPSAKKLSTAPISFRLQTEDHAVSDWTLHDPWKCCALRWRTNCPKWITGTTSGIFLISCKVKKLNQIWVMSWSCIPPCVACMDEHTDKATGAGQLVYLNRFERSLLSTFCNVSLLEIDSLVPLPNTCSSSWVARMCRRGLTDGWRNVKSTGDFGLPCCQKM